MVTDYSSIVTNLRAVRARARHGRRDEEDSIVPLPDAGQ